MLALVIEPSRAARRLVVELLNRQNVETREAEGIADGRQQLKSEQFDLICMAMTLPDGDSAKFCMQIRTREHCPILMLTSSEKREAARRCLAAGVTEIFRKQEFEAFGRYIARLTEQMRNSDSGTGKVLYLEDSKAVATATTQILRGAGFSVDHFPDAEAGVAAFDGAEYDLVLTDVVLEGQMTGIAMLDVVRQHEDPTRRSIPVVAMSGYDDPARRLQLFRAGVSDYVNKPVMPEELLARVRNLVASRRLLNQLAESHERMQSIAMTDQVTGLHNRHYLMETMPGILRNAFSKNQAMCLLVIDLDHFKQINDKHGHAVGDAVLTAVGALLDSKVKEPDLAIRLGGEEFMLILNKCRPNQAAEFAETLRADIEALEPDGVPVTTSIGIADLRLGDDYDSLFHRADEAVYKAKAEGRNRVVAAA